MPIIAVEEDYDDVSRLLSNATVLIETSPKSVKDGLHKEDGDDLGELLTDSAFDQLNISLGNSLSSSTHRGRGGTNARSRKQINNPIAKHEADNDANDCGSLGSTFELCSISSYADPLNASIGRSRRSIDKSIGNSTSSRNRYVMIRKTSSSGQLNRSIGGSNSSNRNKVACTSMNQSSHSMASKLADVKVVPKQENIDTKYFVDYSREIGRGTKTIVRKCIERSTGNRYAVKSVRRADITEYEHMRTEANLLTALNHPSIIKIYDTYEDEKFLHMVVEICKGGELYDHVVKPASKSKKNGGKEVLNCPCEEVAAVIVRRVVDAIAYLHDHNIVHRDLKVRNRYSQYRGRSVASMLLLVNSSPVIVI